MKKFVQGNLTSKQDINDLVGFIAEKVVKTDVKTLLDKAGVKSKPGELDIVDLNDIAVATGIEIKIRVEYEDAQELKEPVKVEEIADQQKSSSAPEIGTSKLPFA